MMQWEIDRTERYADKEIDDEKDKVVRMRMVVSNLKHDRTVDCEVVDLFEKIVDEVEEMRGVTNRP